MEQEPVENRLVLHDRALGEPAAVFTGCFRRLSLQVGGVRLGCPAVRLVDHVQYLIY
jgi:hypothetical protein